MSDAPAASVLAAFGVSGRPRRLAGGQGEAFRVGDVVLKRAPDPEETAWSAGVLASVSSLAFRVPRHFQTHTGAWVVDGWSAQTLLQGAHAFDRWPEVLALCSDFHGALSSVARPDFMALRSDPWAIADRITWGEAPLAYASRLAPFVEPLLDRLAPVASESQVIHGDFAGNVLFADGLAPAVIDFSPYWRPAQFAAAVVVVDAVTWHAAPATLIDHIARESEGAQMLLRAELRRLLEADQHQRQSGRDLADDLEAHRGIVSLLVSRC
ncbi:MAG TPA: phosphotransferase [Caulobacteraceae bacterium]